MAAYAALVSLMNIVDNLRLHPHPPISLHIKQVESLTQKVTFLEEFLEIYNPHLPYTTEADPLESRIVDAAYAAEDVIESHIVDQIKNDGEKVSSDSLYQALETVIEDMASIQEEAMEIKQAMGVQQQLQTNSVRSSSIIAQKSSMAGADDLLLQMKDKLTSNRLQLQIIPVVGMGGTGKTTLAMNIYQDLLIKEHFHIRAWATISQEYDIQDMFIQVLRQLNLNGGSNLNEDELGEILYKHLFGRKYLIVMDDMWSIEAWDGVRRFLPDNKNGSRVVVTTRLSHLASKLPNSNSLDMRLLDEAHSWDLLSKTVFGEQGCCPLELEEIGKKIGKSCKGLPLSIVVVGGFLAKSEPTREFWEYVEENLNSIVNLEDDERCSKILYMSYKQLPVHLKPCFLYMGVYPEDGVICVSKLTELWVTEGFLKPVSGKSLEEIARVYLKDLIGRNLVLIHKLGSIGDVKYCKIHDLLRDLCLREAQRERFYTASSSPQGIINGQRRIVISKKEDINTLLYMPLARSVIWNVVQSVPQLNIRLVRILRSTRVGLVVDGGFLEQKHQFVNSRTVALLPPEYTCPISLFWNIQVLTSNCISTVPTDIWYMPILRHVMLSCWCILPDPPNGQDDIVLENLQTLKFIRNLKCSQQVVKRIPNIKKLGICYDEEVLDGDDIYCLSNLDCLEKLESLHYSLYVEMNEIYFPHSLKKLSLWIYNETQCWEDILDKIGVLPLLQKLKLNYGSFRDEEWVTTEGHFSSLKYLHFQECNGLRVWTTESSHFPCLEHILLLRMRTLVEIPLDIAEIPTLREIHVFRCSDSVVSSTKRILEEQEELYGGEATLQVTVKLSKKNDEALDSYASPNFHVTRY